MSSGVCDLAGNPVGPDSLLDAFGPLQGIVCFAGGGGKKSAMYHIAQAYPGRVAVTTTVRIEPFPRHLFPLSVIGEASSIAGEVSRRTERLVAYAGPAPRPGRFGGVEVELVRRVHEENGFDLTLVKADGARGRLVKAPASHEPVFPETSATVIAVVSARVLGRPLDERIAHRPEQVSLVCGARFGEPLRPTHVARLLASERGALSRVGDRRVVALINMVDNAGLEAAALEAAGQALELAPRLDRVVLAALNGSVARLKAVTR